MGRTRFRIPGFKFGPGLDFESLDSNSGLHSISNPWIQIRAWTRFRIPGFKFGPGLDFESLGFKFGPGLDFKSLGFKFGPGLDFESLDSNSGLDSISNPW